MNKLRRTFLNKISSVLAVGLISPSLAFSSPFKSHRKLTNHETTQIRLGKWIHKNLSQNQRAKLMKSNSTFLKNIENFSNEYIEKQISNDFLNNKTMIVDGVLLSSKEAALLVHSIDYNVQFTSGLT